jgi:uncharacterized damage-inducible protein DinB
MKYDLNLSHGDDIVLASLLGALQVGTQHWRLNLETPPVEAIVWQPTEGAYSIGGILLHMIDCEAYWLKCVTEGIDPDTTHPAHIYNMSMDQYAVGGWPAPPAQPIEWYFELQDAMRAEIIRTVVAHQKPAKEFTRGAKEVTYRWILAQSVGHDSYHGGQCVMLHELWKAECRAKG